MPKLFKNALLIVSLVGSLTFAGNWEWKKAEEYSPSWELPDSYGERLPVFKAHVEGGLKGWSCGYQATAFYKLAMQLNVDNLRRLINNWKDLAFPLALYTVATYFPVVKEAMVGAEYLSDTIATLSNMNCRATMKMIETYNKKTSKIVRSCVLKRLGKNLNIWTATPEQIERALANVSEEQIREAYAYCMNHASLLDALPLPDVQKILREYNPRKLIMCNYIKALGLKDLGKEYVADKKILTTGGDLKTLAKLYLLAITPEFIVDSNTKEILLKPIKLNDGTPVNLQTLGKILNSSVKEKLKNLEKKVLNGEDLETFLGDVENLLKEYSLKPTEGIKAYFLVWYTGLEKYSQVKSVNPLRAEEMKASLDHYRDTLALMLQKWALKTLLLYAQDYLNQREVFLRQKEILGEGEICNE